MKTIMTIAFLMLCVGCGDAANKEGGAKRGPPVDFSLDNPNSPTISSIVWRLDFCVERGKPHDENAGTMLATTFDAGTYGAAIACCHYNSDDFSIDGVPQTGYLHICRQDAADEFTEDWYVEAYDFYPAN